MKNVINTTMEGYGQGWEELKARHRTESAAAALGGAAHICSPYKDRLKIGLYPFPTLLELGTFFSRKCINIMSIHCILPK